MSTYREFWRVVDAARAAPESQDWTPKIKALATGQALQSALLDVANFASLPAHVVGTVTRDPSVAARHAGSRFPSSTASTLAAAHLVSDRNGALSWTTPRTGWSDSTCAPTSFLAQTAAGWSAPQRPPSTNDAEATDGRASASSTVLPATLGAASAELRVTAPWSTALGFCLVAAVDPARPGGPADPARKPRHPVRPTVPTPEPTPLTSVDLSVGGFAGKFIDKFGRAARRATPVTTDVLAQEAIRLLRLPPSRDPDLGAGPCLRRGSGVAVGGGRATERRAADRDGDRGRRAGDGHGASGAHGVGDGPARLRW